MFQQSHMRMEAWELGLYSLELPWQTDIDIVEITD